MSSPNPGIVSPADETRPTATYLPLESLSAHVYIADVSARVVLSQLYSNSAPTALKEAHYVFPVPARAAVCSFEVRTDNGRRLKGVVKEITQAKAEYEEAVRQGGLAALLEQFRRDVFAVCIGRIPARTNVTVSLSYVIDLSEDDQYDTVRFHLPLHVGARYGAPPTSRLHLGTNHRARASITVEVEMASEIARVTSPSHKIEEVSQSSQSILENRYKCVRWVSEDEFLTKDFVLVVQASGLDIPRCLAETLMTSGNSSYSPDGERTTALALTIVPRFGLPTLPEQEYLFLVDRSYSMTGVGIDTAKRALGFLLKMLPSRSGAVTKFNIFSFGDQCTSLWPHSQDYNNSTLPIADYEVDAMGANMGGTELQAALKTVFAARSDIMPTAVFVLTDGRVHYPQPIIDYVREMAESAPPSAPLRLFTLSVGNSPSTELCEGIAAAGNGACVTAEQTEDLMLKSIRLVEAMRVSTVGALTVDWGMPGQALQAQDPIPTISPGVRTVVTAILSGTAPTQVTLRGTLSNEEPLEYTVPVHPLSPRLPNTHMEHSWPFSGVPPLLHTLAAHRYIQGLDGRSIQPRGPRFDGLSPSTHRQRVVNLIVELGIQYQVASSRTAFIAVDTPIPPSRRTPTLPREDPPKIPSPKDCGKKSPPDSRSRHESSADDSETFKTASERSGRGPEGAAKSSRKNSVVVTSPKHSGTSNSDVDTFKTASERTGHRAEEGADHQNSTPKTRQTSRKTVSSPPHGQGSSGSLRQADFYAFDPPPVDTVTQEVLVLPDPMGGKPVIFTAPPLFRTSIFPQFLRKSFWSLMVRPVDTMRQIASAAASVLPPEIQQRIWQTDIDSTTDLLDFSRSQAADGSFALTGLASKVGISTETLNSSIPSALASMDNGEQVWATAIAVAFFRLKHPRHKEVWEIVQEKAVEYGSQSLQGGSVSFDDMIKEAQALLSSSPS